jgi:cytochrome c55X
VALCAVPPAAALADGEPDHDRRQVLHNMVVQDCGSCHGLTFKGGLGSPLLPDDLQGVDDGTIAAIVLDGVPGTPMPPWRGLLSESEALWIARGLKAGVFQ